ncbi:MAG: aspartate dehydrogenase [archaeon]
MQSNPETTTIDTLIESSDLVIECAHKNSVYEIVSKAIHKKKDILVMSVSGLIDNPRLLELAKENNTNIYIPTGAIAGIDALKAARQSSITSVTLTTTKPKAGLKGAPYITENNINLDTIKKKTQIFEGNVYEAIKGFPLNVNVSATLALAGIGPEKTKVRIILDPLSTINSHEIEITGDFGKITTRTENTPCPANPKTSYLAALSAIAKIKDMTEPIRIGT